LTALLDNGCEAAKGESYVQVSLDKDDISVRITVETHGATLSDSQLERAFLPTFSGWDRKRRGLGLTIALVEARRVGGDLHLRRTEKGVASTLEFPLSAAGIDSSRTNVSSSPIDSSRGEMMLVDADNTSRGLLRTALESEGWRVHEASYGAASLALMRALPKKPELLLCDLSLTSSFHEPWIRGLLEMENEVRILFFVADAGDVQAAVEATGVGVESILSKPFSPADLIRFIGE